MNQRKLRNRKKVLSTGDHRLLKRMFGGQKEARLRPSKVQRDHLQALIFFAAGPRNCGPVGGVS